MKPGLYHITDPRSQARMEHATNNYSRGQAHVVTMDVEYTEDKRLFALGAGGRRMQEIPVEQLQPNTEFRAGLAPKKRALQS